MLISEKFFQNLIDIGRGLLYNSIIRTAVE